MDDLVTTVFEPGSRSEVAVALPSASEPAFQVGDVLYIGSGQKRVRVTGVEYVLNVTKTATGPHGAVAGRMVLTESFPQE